MLRALAETVKPATEAEIGDFVRHQINYAKVIKALKTLRALNLVVVKRRPAMPDVLELHPMVRTFVRQNFSTGERIPFINGIIKVYQQLLGAHESQLEQRPALSVLQYWTETAELDIAAGRIGDAFHMLENVANAFASSAYPREFTRIARMLLSAADWLREHSKYRSFESVFNVHVELLSHLGEYTEVDELLEKYERTVPSHDARYIHYCEMRAHSKWVRADFTAAVDWAKIGQGLKDTGVDTEYDVSHTLALAQRDAGHPEIALPIFLGDQTLKRVLDPDELDEERGGPFYGNIGRCLHFMGQTDAALVCYQKSALLIEKGPSTQHVLNQGYIRAWIGELLAARGQVKLAKVFLRASHDKWEHIAPPKAARALAMSKQLQSTFEADLEGMTSGDLEKVCLDWILGHGLDTEFQDAGRVGETSRATRAIGRSQS